ncbi:thiamine pyrophosphate-dependent enzyme [Isoptericola sp. b515]|uniref:thiamine pyrophosphate-dependent enzyme n=1 Tax=Isoptericola sp. b515 TaxID=3064652 RepID=UPI0027130188|nr:thiamine pyrophosphate-dependent enzyme [Isoptericola sp. b515]MDO8147394.1 thiamine pyrophosphate-dependent enzyme [Isoptericola sp. b515]
MTTPALAPDRVRDLVARVTGDEKHDPSAHSTLDVVRVLYDRVLHVDPDRPDDPDRDRFVLSKGHGPASTYAVLAARGFFPAAWLDDVASWSSRLGHHPDRTLVPGIEIGSGSLGHGLPLAVGMAIGLRGRSPARVVVLVGDAELDEGSNAEAIQVAGRFGLANLTCVVVDNRSDDLGWPGGIAARFALEGWTTTDVDNRSDDRLAAALNRRGADRPTAVVVDTTRAPEAAA